MSAPPGRGLPFVVAAPSGTGKTTVCRRVVAADPGIVFSVSHTTRASRPGERHGEDYHFVTPAEFEQMVECGDFLEWAEYGQHRYGTSWAAVEKPLERGRDVLLEIEVQGARQVRKSPLDARQIFLLPPSFQALERRLRGRGTDSDAQIEGRLRIARGELRALPEFDYAVFNEDLERCVADVLEIVAGERVGRVDGLRRRFDPAAAARRLREGARADLA